MIRIPIGKGNLTVKKYAVRLKCLEEWFGEKSINIKHVSTRDQLADILTRFIITKPFGTLRDMIIRMLLIKSACRTYDNKFPNTR